MCRINPARFPYLLGSILANKWTMRVLSFLAFAFAIGNAHAQLVGIWKPEIQHGKVSGEQAKRIQVAKAKLSASSLKLNKDKTFGSLMIDKVMRGTWKFDGKVLTLTVTSIVGVEENKFSSLPKSDRFAQMAFKNGKLTTLPIKAGGPNMVWRKVK